MKTAKYENLVGKVITLKNGRRGKCACRLESGEYLLAAGKGGQISEGFHDVDILSVDS